MHTDQFTATGPANTGSGHSRAAFSNNPQSNQAPQDFVYGVNVQGARCGVLGESVVESSGRDSQVDGTGVYGFGEHFGVMGNGNRGIAGVYGVNNRGRSGVIGAVMRGGTGVVGLSLNSLGNPLETLETIPDPADGDGTGVLGVSGTGRGVRGSSSTGVGVHGESVEGNGVSGKSQVNDGVVGESDSEGKSGVVGFNTSTFGAAFGVTGATRAPNGAGVFGIAASIEGGVGGVGVRGDSPQNDGVSGQSHAPGKSGVVGTNSTREGVAFGVFGQCDSVQGAGVSGRNDSTGDAVSGFASRGVAVRGTSLGNDGVVGHSEAVGKSGVLGENTGVPGAIGGPGLSTEVFGVVGRANAASGIGVFGHSTEGIGVSGTGGTYGASLQGGRAPLRLVPAASKGAPKSGIHERGELLVDDRGRLYFCTVTGTPGTWKRVQLVDA